MTIINNINSINKIKLQINLLRDYSNKITSKIEHERYASSQEEYNYEDEFEYNKLNYQNIFHFVRLLLFTLCEQNGLNYVKTEMAHEYDSIKGDLYKTFFIPDIEEIELDSLYFIYKYSAIIFTSLGNEMEDQLENKFKSDLTILLRVLRSAPILAKKLNIKITKESDIQNIYDAILPAIFPYSKNKPPGITSPIKNYIPDFGIIDIKTLIEFKYINSPRDLPKCIDEICADMANYSRSKDWENYIVLFYCDKHYATEDQLITQFSSIPTSDKWIPVLVVGE